MSERLVRFASALLEKRISRRSMLVRMATAGSALAVAPIRYATRPLSAMAVITCANCPPGSPCCDGYTTFCCTINPDHSNTCPPWTFMGGWWKCTNYTGNLKCDEANVRYYIDCNRLPSKQCPGGCHCANDSCTKRKTCCNVFRYGQCNTQIPEVTAIACRMVSCTNPCTAFPNQCNCTYKVDDNTCSHEGGCLKEHETGEEDEMAAFANGAARYYEGRSRPKKGEDRQAWAGWQMAHDMALLRRVDVKLARRLGVEIDDERNDKKDESTFVDKLVDLLEKAANCGCP